MTSRGTVRVWHADEGWGVVDSTVTPGGCWAHYSDVLVPGYRTLGTGQAVEFTFEPADQDGYAFRAVEVWPADQAPVRDGTVDSGPSPAHRSTLTVTFDSADEAGSP